MRTTRAMTLSALALTALLASLTASADADRTTVRLGVEPMTVKIRIDDLEPATERGARALYRRIVTVAKQICWAPLDDWKGVISSTVRDQSAECFDAAVDKAVAEVRGITRVDIEDLAKLDRHAEAGLTVARR